MSKFIVSNLLKKLELSLWHRVPVIHQTESAECGLACLGMICAYYGKNLDLNSLRQQFNLSTRGTTFLGLIRIAVELGMAARPLSLDINEVKNLRKPCILHWEFNHFVVLVSVSRRRALIHDPARGERSVTLAELSTCFTGVALEVWPGTTFTCTSRQNQLRLRTLIGSVHGLLGALGKIFCLSLMVETINLMIPVGTQLVMDHVIPAGDRGLLTVICFGLIFFIFLRAAISMMRTWCSMVMATSINVQWKSGLFRHMLQLPLSYFERRKLGGIQSRFNSLDTLRSTFTTSIVGAIMDFIMVTGALVMLILYGGRLSLVVVFFTLLYVSLRLVTYDRYRQLSEEALVRNARSSSYFMETLFSIAAVKIQGMTERRSTHWLNLEIDSINTSIRITKMEMLFGGIKTFISACDQVVVLWLGTHMVIDNQMTIGMFVAFGVFRGQVSERMGSLLEFALQLRMMGLHNERLADIALHPEEECQPDLPRETSLPPASLHTYALSYRYDSHSLPVFSELSIAIGSGESLAIVGPSGAGKTTLLKVLCGLLSPDCGRVEVNGVDIRHLGINNYRKMIACVMQDDKLFSGSVCENICSFADNVDIEWMQECARISCLHDVIMSMPMGYETLIGELGEGLSGGQKQRLFLARAIYRRPAVLFLDEATSALDKESEEWVNQSIKKLNITRVIIAHRETTIASADRVIYLGK